MASSACLPSSLVCCLVVIAALFASVSEGGSHARQHHHLAFAAIGDYGYNGTEGEAEVVAAMNVWCAKMGCPAAISAGDNFYPMGVSSVDDPQFATSFADLFAGDLLVSLGNHDYYGNPAAEIEYASVNPRWQLPERYYVHWLHGNHNDVEFPAENGDLPHVRLVVLDSTPLIRSYSNDSRVNQTDYQQQKPDKQIEWLQAVLADTSGSPDGRPFITVVVAHHPAYTPAVGTELLPPAVVALLRWYRVPLVITGHSHNLQHVWFEDRSYPQFVVSGAGGALEDSELSQQACDGCQYWYSRTNGFTGVLVNATHIDVQYCTIDLRVIHSFAIQIS